MITKQVVLVFLVWFGCAVVFFAAAAVAFETPKYYALVTRGIETKGVVVTKEPENHSFIRYSYLVNQQAYAGLGNAGGINRSFVDLNPGDTVRVYYDSEDPSISHLGDPKAHYASSVRGVAFVTLLGPIFCLVGLFAKGWLPGLRKPKPPAGES
ncbi:MAG TPA: DUF3592 domain-containing protein [Pyrinomonadaceae bacterium]|nr:DUF3592 domain-containing protein [Pyrinomonadaceae bacterium]